MDNLTRSLNEIRASNSWRNFLRDNKKLGPIVRGYLAGTGRRPTEAELGQNHYARGLVLIEDERRRRSVHPLWKRDVVFSRTLSNFSGNERTAALTRGWTVIANQVLNNPQYEAANLAEEDAIRPGLEAVGWAVIGWGTYGQNTDPHDDGVRAARMVQARGYVGWIANGETWAEEADIWKSRAFLDGWHLAGGGCPLAVSCLASNTYNFNRAFDFDAWLAEPGCAIMPQVYGYPEPSYTVDAELGSLARNTSVPTYRLNLTFSVAPKHTDTPGLGPFADYNTWPGPRGLWTGDDSTLATFVGLDRT